MEFKVGDWVRNTELNRIFKYSYSDLVYDKANPSHGKHDELWQPKVGEWVWSQVGDSKIPTVIEVTQQHIDEDWLNSNNCEPFIGELPSFIKDK